MSGTNPVATFGQTNFTIQTGTQYKTQIDSNSIVMQRVVDCFAPRQTTTPAMTVTLDPGFVFKGTTLAEVAAQTTGTITAPSGNPRIDRVVIDRFTGTASVVTGTPAASPVAPAIPTGKVPVCQVLIQTSSTTITNPMITDERALYALGRGLAGEEGIGQWLGDDGAGNLTISVNATLRDNGSGMLSTGLTTEATITATATTNLGTMTSNIGVITGNTGINSFGNSASTANPFYMMRVTGTPLLANGANMILPGAANYQCAAGDILFCKFEGSSKWRVGILTASGKPVVNGTTAPNVYQSTPSAPTGTSSSSPVMMGLSGLITPNSTGCVRFTITGTFSNSGAVGTVGIQGCYGTGSAPGNGAGASGAGFSAALATNPASQGGIYLPFSVSGTISGLTLGTQVWFDLSLSNNNGNTSSVKDLCLEAHEIK